MIFTAPSTGASATAGGSNTVQVKTDSSGIARATFQANAVTGSYTVMAIGVIAPVTTNFTLTNTSAASGPAISQNPASVTVNAGATAQFTAAASGSPTPSVQWQQSIDGGNTFSNVAGATSATLSFTATLAGSGYLFRAVFTNSVNTATTTAATLAVQTGPTVTQSPANVTVNAGTTAQFTTGATGTPTPTVRWQQSADGGTTFSNVAGATSTTLSFAAALAQNGYRFRAVFSNKVASATTTAAILTVQPGHAPCDLNGNGSADVADVQIIINEALGVALAVDDLSGDRAVNVTDIQLEINAALGLGCSVTHATPTASSARQLPPSDEPTSGVALTELGAVDGLSTTAYGINNLGQIVGASTPDSLCQGRPCLRRAFLWNAGRMTELAFPGEGNATSSAAFSINDSGQIAGDYWHPDQQGGSFLYAAGHMTLLSIAPGSRARAINNAGQVVGDVSPASATSSGAFLWKAGTMTVPETFGGDGAHASAINDVGQVVGFAYVRDHSAFHALLCDGVTSTDLGTLGGTNSVAFGVNVAGQIVGSSQTIGDRRHHAFLSSKGLMTDLGTLGGDDSQANGINGRGLIVGWAKTAGGDQHAFLWSGGRMLDLNSLVSLGADTVLVEATAISDVGQLIANGSKGRAYLITLPARLQ